MTTKEQRKLDKETRTVVEAQQKVKSLTQHEGWPIVKALFIKKVAELLNLADVNIMATGQSNGMGFNVAQEVGMRQLAAARLIEILNDVQGTADQFDANEALTSAITESYVERYSS